MAKLRTRPGWLIIWPDGTEWRGDCREWAFKPLGPGVTRREVRIAGRKRWPCSGCTLGFH